MELWQSFDLTPKTLRHFVNNLNALKKMMDDEEKVDLFFNRFPFEKLLNVTVMDSNSLSLSISILNFLSDYKEFYSYEDSFNYCMEFILINISQCTKDCKEICSLFRLLSKILDNNVKSIGNSFKNVFDRERILEAMLKISKFETLHKNNFQYYSPILYSLLKQDIPDSIERTLSELFESLKYFGAFPEMCIICNYLLNRSIIFDDIFNNVSSWLIDECPVILTECNDETLVMEILNCLSVVSSKFIVLKYVKENKNPKFIDHAHRLYQNLIRISSDICLNTSNPCLRLDSFKLLEFILLEFCNEEKLQCFTRIQVSEELNKLPVAVEKWPQGHIDIFFCICHMVICYSRMIWEKQDVLNAIILCFYRRRYSINIFVLKSIYFLYPILIDALNDNYIEIVGNDLLNYFMKFCSVPHLYSYNDYQLKWIMKKASNSLKIIVLRQWINSIEDHEQLALAIQNCEAESILLKLVMGNNLEKHICLKSAALLKRLNNPELSREIALKLPEVIDNPPIFYNLILSEPGIPLNSDDSILICTLMGAIIPSLNDAEVLRGACIFSSKLLSSLKNHPDVVKEFCKNIYNIRHLIDIMAEVDEDTSVEIIRLLKVIIIIQRLNNVTLNENLKEDFSVFISGSTEKIEKGLKLLQHIMNYYNHSLISIKEKCFLEIYHKMLDFTENPSLIDLAYLCLVGILRRMPWLAFTITTSIYIEMSCLSTLDNVYSMNFLKVLDIWLKILRRQFYNILCPIPEAAIRSFIMRASLDKQKTQTYLTLLEELARKQC